MKILVVTDNLYPEMGGSFRAITDTHKIMLNNEKYKSRIVLTMTEYLKKN